MTNSLTIKAPHIIHLPACGMTTIDRIRVRRTPSYTTPIYGYDQTAIVLPSPLQHDTIHTYDDTYSTFTHNTDNTIESTQINTSRTTSSTPQTPLYASTMSSAQNYYGYRYYSTDLGRWINRDPIEERGGNNIYRFGKNCPIKGGDRLGRCWSRARAVAHYENPFSGGVTLAQTDCVAEVTTATLTVRNQWVSDVREQAEATARAMQCPAGGTVPRYFHDTESTHSGVWWIGRISLAQSATCTISRDCSACSWSYVCSIENEMNDMFEEPFNFDDTRDDWWDDIEIGRPFNVSHTWTDTAVAVGYMWE